MPCHHSTPHHIDTSHDIALMVAFSYLLLPLQREERALELDGRDLRAAACDSPSFLLVGFGVMASSPLATLERSHACTTTTATPRLCLLPVSERDETRPHHPPARAPHHTTILARSSRSRATNGRRRSDPRGRRRDEACAILTRRRAAPRRADSDYGFGSGSIRDSIRFDRSRTPRCRIRSDRF